MTRLARLPIRCIASLQLQQYKVRGGGFMDSAVEHDEQLTRPPWGELGRVLTLTSVWAAGKFVVQAMNTTTVVDGHHFQRALLDRESGAPLITVCNHTSTVDDPFIFGALIPFSYISSEHRHKGVRWSLCAKEICYKHWLLGQFFQSGKVLPVDRGQGIAQPVMQVAAARAARGEWVHLFPEGRVGYSGSLAPCKWGVGKVICDAAAASDRDPVVVPFFHSGMGRVLPKTFVVPRWGNDINVTVGSPLDLAEQLAKCRSGRDSATRQQAWKDITMQIRAALLALQERSPPNWVQMPAAPDTRGPPVQAPIHTNV